MRILILAGILINLATFEVVLNDVTLSHIRAAHFPKPLIGYWGKRVFLRVVLTAANP